MQALRFALAAVLLSLTTAAFAQHDAPMSNTPKSDAEKSFDKLKTLTGSWEGRVTTIPPQAEIEGKQMQVTLRETSMGNALMHEMTGAGKTRRPDHHAVSGRGSLAPDPLL